MQHQIDERDYEERGRRRSVRPRHHKHRKSRSCHHNHKHESTTGEEEETATEVEDSRSCCAVVSRGNNRSRSRKSEGRFKGGSTTPKMNSTLNAFTEHSQFRSVLEEKALLERQVIEYKAALAG
jgi:hypothetical protein